MESDGILSLIGPQPLLVVGGLLCLLALIAFFLINRKVQQALSDVDHIDHRLNTLWHELDTLRLDPAPSADQPLKSGHAPEPSPEKFAAERAVYETLWPLIWTLHDKVGTFLRAVDNRESHSESRLAARHAALEVRSQVNRMRPFFDENIDRLLSQLLDVEIKAHLTACQYLDRGQSQTAVGAEGIETQPETLRHKWRMLYDSEATELVNQLVDAIRRRTLPPGAPGL
ncbi:hypothetical protein [Marinobacter fonticola]|uniref:hypothetical protein n=1 Tax=Marinobacter fonticola TaxID=2603215 RepID=UPI0011E69336|nr:hypothetical protein [Marinobacter fonticola]